MGLTIGIDIGGTFTDVVALDPNDGINYCTKVQSTPGDPAQGVIAGLEKVLRLANRGLSEVDRVVHSSTVSLNAIIEHKGACLGLLTTKGFGDLLVIGRQKRTDMYNLFMDAETPLFLCPRERIFGIAERLDSTGKVVLPLDEATVESAVASLVERHKVTAIAVCYMFSYLNSAHETRTRKIILDRYPHLKISLSSDVDPRIREYERLVMTAFDAYIKPVVENYLESLAGKLSKSGSRATLQIMQSRGGITGWQLAASCPVTAILSGPAAGVIGGTHSGRSADFSNVITVDIGGTSCDIALVTDGKPLVTTEGRVDRYPLRQQMIDVNCIGAGGGSIAWVDRGGALKVGPQSAGANPGPACYGRGGTEPTITDASVVLGYLNPAQFGCGELSLIPEFAQQALERLARRVGIGAAELALGMHRILNSKMADAIRLVSIKRGFDPRRFGLLALGGNGPVHAGALAQNLHCSHAIVPPLPGVLCAAGLLAADIEHEHSRTFLRAVDAVDPAELERMFYSVIQVCAERMRADDVDPAHARLLRFVDARYSSQSYELELTVPDGPITRGTLVGLARNFHEVHEHIYGHAQRNQRVVCVTVRAVLSFGLAEPHFSGVVGSGSLDDARHGERSALFDLDVGYRPIPVFERIKLPPGALVVGPAILEQPDTTTVIYPGQAAKTDQHGNLVIAMHGSGS